ncbi:type II secretion system F family protein [Candidatus Poriferisodalis sp.]|uniref:type II secretion system F family protein n=1 Tax=Candidatus Poriferisodalis sp. TaxID=3101277 RepID=UPI003B017BD9
MNIAISFGLLFAGCGLLCVLAQSGALNRESSRVDSGSRSLRLYMTLEARKQRRRRALGTVSIVQIIAGTVGLATGWLFTGLAGMAVLLAGLGVMLPPFFAAPKRRRHQTREALAWSLWSRQLAELARAGSGLADSLRSSVEHAPIEIRHTIEQISAKAHVSGLETALEELGRSGRIWEPEVAAGLKMAAKSGGSVADPLLDMCGRIADVVELHRARTEAVVQLWTQTIALLGLASGIVTLMYRNNPTYFEVYSTPTGQMVFVLIAGMLLMSIGFLVFHSVVRGQESVLIPPKRRSRAREPI